MSPSVTIGVLLAFVVLGFWYRYRKAQLGIAVPGLGWGRKRPRPVRSRMSSSATAGRGSPPVAAGDRSGEPARRAQEQQRQEAQDPNQPPQSPPSRWTQPPLRPASPSRAPVSEAGPVAAQKRHFPDRLEGLYRIASVLIDAGRRRFGGGVEGGPDEPSRDGDSRWQVPRNSGLSDRARSESLVAVDREGPVALQNQPERGRDDDGYLESRPDLFHLAVAAIGDAFWHWDLKEEQFRFSAGFEILLGLDPGELKPRPEEWLGRVHYGYSADLKKCLAEYLQGENDDFRHEHRLRRKDGTYVWVLARASAGRDRFGNMVAVSGSLTDITRLIEVERRLLDDAFQDSLTGLPNRHFLMGRLDTAIVRKQRQGASAPLFGVLFLDLDGFKPVNDTYGHLAGDQLLIAVAARLQSGVRSEDVVARFGGDEFVILLARLRRVEDALEIADRIGRAIGQPFEVSRQAPASGSRPASHPVTVRIGASIGLALSTETFESGEDLVRLGDVAMYHAKTAGKGRVSVYQPQMQQQVAGQGSRSR